MVREHVVLADRACASKRARDIEGEVDRQTDKRRERERERERDRDRDGGRGRVRGREVERQRDWWVGLIPKP